MLSDTGVPEGELSIFHQELRKLLNKQFTNMQ